MLEQYPLTEIRYSKIQNLDFPILCPDCKSEMKIKNSKRRFIKDSLGRKIPFNFKRYSCPVCCCLHTEIPDIVKPYCQYEQSVIEEVQKGNTDSFYCDDSTIRYWKRQNKKGN